MTILEQTHGYLTKLGAKVSLQKSQNAAIAVKKNVDPQNKNQKNILQSKDAEEPNVEEEKEDANKIVDSFGNLID
jgi:ribosomal protein S30